MAGKEKSPTTICTALLGDFIQPNIADLRLPHSMIFTHLLLRSHYGMSWHLLARGLAFNPFSTPFSEQTPGSSMVAHDVEESSPLFQCYNNAVFPYEVLHERKMGLTLISSPILKILKSLQDSHEVTLSPPLKCRTISWKTGASTTWLGTSIYTRHKSEEVRLLRRLSFQGFSASVCFTDAGKIFEIKL
ncbi:uncharacterized protein CLUP02_06356 [Colletotrichum lupini]|uniref:Uncharacterized protein n=1 Tax=Colletotrichum lupini TaxID=145971 RepID=A0A9Q8WF14_9PEZI|nr:uncharacterized protein CLUP02_06356 [Colletotrichum lupini]UQC80871.1 hypothetical protein CLUP02_06356 [Colletotrichum lupini]